MDYRRATLSSQIVTKQVKRKDALEILKKTPYDEVKIEKAKEYIAKKYGISLNQFNEYLSLTPKTYKDFPNSRNLIQSLYKLYRKIHN